MSASAATGAAAAAAAMIPGGQVAAGVLGVASGVLSIFGGAQKDRNEKKAINRKYEYDMDMWEHSDDERLRNYEYRQEGIEINRQNALNNIAYQEATAVRKYQYDKDIQDYRYDLAVREYEQSEQNYELQLGFNNMAAAEAYESEQRAFNEIMVAQAFAREDLDVQKVAQLGQAKMLQAGRSSSAVQATSLAQIGSSISRLDESFRSARTETQSSMRDIAMRQYGANLRAHSNRILEPQRLPDIPKPLALPTPIFQDAYLPGESPKPVKGVAQGGGLLAGLASGLPQAAGGFNQALLGISKMKK
jgi:hypothetical protein